MESGTNRGLIDVALMEAPKGFKEMVGMRGLLKTLWNMAPKELRSAPCQDVVWEGTHPNPKSKFRSNYFDSRVKRR